MRENLTGFSNQRLFQFGYEAIIIALVGVEPTMAKKPTGFEPAPYSSSGTEPCSDGGEDRTLNPVRACVSRTQMYTNSNTPPKIIPEEGFEPSRPKAQDPESCMYTNSNTLASIYRTRDSNSQAPKRPRGLNPLCIPFHQSCVNRGIRVRT
jgi:hypothetical protein